MFKFLKLNSNECYVSKKEELKKAIVSIDKIIVVEGMLATQILKAQEFHTMSNFSKKNACFVYRNYANKFYHSCDSYCA